ncbi:DNA oxidative demethylase AlkB [Methylophilus sp. 5]|uniref:DNA oxidative demethylase AlkB n=1 Tax=Methylophilus sp. 5 TaxID=1112274 RepID=UPI00048F026E|nr:DNA oxidative demethylase AlkB [Methylophilus sp. 5]
MDLFSAHPTEPVALAIGAYWLPGFALPCMPLLWQCLQQHLLAHPAQHMMTPMGYPMSVATSSMGRWGWVSDAQSYGYSAHNPLTEAPWQAIPPVILQLAAQAAEQAGYARFVPDSCLINSYAPDSKMGLHRDKDEQDFSQPIVSVSLGLPAIFMFGGAKRSDKTAKIPLQHGDVVVWGGASRRFYHGVAAVKPGTHPLTGSRRINLTLRQAK